MKPQGRKIIKIQPKPHPKSAGKNITAWWEVIAGASNKRSRRDAKRNINDQIDNQ